MRTFPAPDGVDPDDPVWQRLAATSEGIDRELHRRGLIALHVLPEEERRQLIIGVQLELNRLAEASGQRTWPLNSPYPDMRVGRRFIARKRARARAMQLDRRRSRTPRRRRPRR